MPTGKHALAIATLLSWLITEGLGAYMLRRWFSSGAARQRVVQPGGDSMPIVLGHAGLAFTGFLCWLSYLASSAAPVAWAAVGLLAPAIGLGISTVTVWTPYPVHRIPPGSIWPDGAAADQQRGVLTDDMVRHALTDEALTSKLVDDLLERNLAHELEPARRPRSDLRPLIPLAHGIMAIITFMLATLAAVAGT